MMRRVREARPQPFAPARRPEHGVEFLRVDLSERFGAEVERVAQEPYIVSLFMKPPGYNWYRKLACKCKQEHRHDTQRTR